MAALRKKLVIRLIITAILAFLLQGITWRNQGLALTPQQAESLRDAGLSQQTVYLLHNLSQESNRTREPDLTYEKVKKLADEGMAEDLIQLLIHLDRVSSRQPRMTITSADLGQLKKNGVSDQTLRLMLLSEIEQAGGAISGQTISQLGKQVVTRPDGIRVIVYSAGDPNKPTLSSKQKQEEEVRQAWDLLKNLKIEIELPSSQPE